MQSKPLTVEEFKQHLVALFKQKKLKSKSYSVRAMSSELGVAASTLHKVFNGERKLGARLAKEIAAKTGVQIVAKTVATKRKRLRFNQLNPNSDVHVTWLNLAILEMIKLDQFRPDLSWIAQRIGISETVLSETLNRMEAAGMLKRTATQWIDLLGESSVHAEKLLTTDTIRTELKKIMKVSTDKIEQVPYEKREHSFTLFPIASGDLPKLKKQLVRLSLDFTTKAQKSKSPKNAVYAFQLGFFPVTSTPNS